VASQSGGVTAYCRLAKAKGSLSAILEGPILFRVAYFVDVLFQLRGTVVMRDRLDLA